MWWPMLNTTATIYIQPQPRIISLLLHNNDLAKPWAIVATIPRGFAAWNCKRELLVKR
jgi:hypothetical protein